MNETLYGFEDSGTGSSNQLPVKEEFQPCSIHSVLTLGCELLTKAGIDSPRLDARILLQHATDLTHEQIISSPNQVINSDLYLQLINRRTIREPVSHIIGKREFYGIEFKVNAHTLDPRPDSETLINIAITYCHNQPLRILDLGTGSGCLLLTLLTLYPNSTGVGVDISPDALVVAQANSVRLGLTERTKFITSNWGQDLAEQFDLIIANPPYIKAADIKYLAPEVREFEPHSALTGGEDGLECYRQIAKILPQLLKPKAVIIFEFCQDQQHQISDILAANNITTTSYHQDLAGITRCLVGKRQASHHTQAV